MATVIMTVHLQPPMEFANAFEKAERLKARNSEFTADWSEYDLLLLEGFTDEFVVAANRMWSAASASEDWASAHRKCG